MKDKIRILQKDLDEIKTRSFARFNYRERIKLERTLHLLLNDVLEIKVEGFSFVNTERVKAYLSEIDAQEEIVVLVDKIFELRSFLKAITRGNPYEKYDALYKADLNRISVFDNIEMRLKKIEKLIDTAANKG